MKMLCAVVMAAGLLAAVAASVPGNPIAEKAAKTSARAWLAVGESRRALEAAPQLGSGS